jgi:protein gp37
MTTPIQWVQNEDGSQGRTWNPLRGCSLESAGCTHCYAMRTAFRFNGPGKAFEGLTRARASLGPVWTGDLRTQPEMLVDPMTWSKPTTVFVNSMSDLFHPDVPDEFIAAVFGIMAACPQHTFQVLTKRSARMRAWFAAYATAWWGKHPATLAEMAAHQGKIGGKHGRSLNLKDLAWPLDNVILGVSAESQEYAAVRVTDLLQTPAVRRFVSLEPLLGEVRLRALSDGSWYDREGADYYDALRGAAYWSDGSHGLGGGPRLDWVIVGGESGPGARSFDLAWARVIVEECASAGVACFVKQMGARPMDSARLEVLNERGCVAYVRDADDPDGMLAEARSMGRGVQPHRLRFRDGHGGDPSEWPEALRVRQGAPRMRAGEAVRHGA